MWIEIRGLSNNRFYGSTKSDFEDKETQLSRVVSTVALYWTFLKRLKGIRISLDLSTGKKYILISGSKTLSSLKISNVIKIIETELGFK